MLQRGKKIAFACLTLSTLTASISYAEARSSRALHHVSARHMHHMRHIRRIRHHRHILQCVGFVHQATDFKIHGNARDWWSRAKGLYARGHVPEAGAVLSFRPRRRMPLGHVAVVKSKIDNRTILIDQAHWGRNIIDRNVRVIDTSPNNNWSTIRVALRGDKSRFGSVYAINGFIYNRPEGSTPIRGNVQDVLASNTSDSDQQEAALSDQPNTRDIFDDDAPNRSIR